MIDLRSALFRIKVLFCLMNLESSLSRYFQRKPTHHLKNDSYPLYLLDPCSLFNRFKECVRFVGVENFVAVHDGDKILRFRQVDDVVGIAREHVNGFYLVPRYEPIQYQPRPLPSPLLKRGRKRAPS